MLQIHMCDLFLNYIKIVVYSIIFIFNSFFLAHVCFSAIWPCPMIFGSSLQVLIIVYTWEGLFYSLITPSCFLPLTTTYAFVSHTKLIALLYGFLICSSFWIFTLLLVGIFIGRVWINFVSIIVDFLLSVSHILAPTTATMHFHFNSLKIPLNIILWDWLS